MTQNTATSILRIARRASGCRVLGPGLRATVWFHGCSRNCPGCIAMEMNRSTEFERWSPEGLSAWVSSCAGIEGVTLSGGEPLEQEVSALEEFLRIVKADKRGLGVILFTGYCLEELSDEVRQEVLPHVDVLVDGPYRQELDDSRDLRGSSNQRIHFLTERYRATSESFFGAECRNLEIDVGLDNRVAMNGIPPRGLVEEFSLNLQHQGYLISFN